MTNKLPVVECLLLRPEFQEDDNSPGTGKSIGVSITKNQEGRENGHDQTERINWGLDPHYDTVLRYASSYGWIRY